MWVALVPGSNPASSNVKARSLRRERRESVYMREAEREREMEESERARVRRVRDRREKRGERVREIWLWKIQE